MGFWSSLWSGVRSVASAAWNGVKSIARGIGNLFSGGREKADEIGEYYAYDRESATAAETQRINASLSEFKNNALERATQLEDEMQDKVGDMFDKVLYEIDKINNKSFLGVPLRLPTTQIKQENRRTLREIRGTIKNEIMPKISIDDSECNEILKLPAGSEKKERMYKFINTSLKDSVKTLRDKIDDNMQSCVENTNDKLETRMHDMQDRAMRDIDTLNRLKEGEGKDIDKKEVEQLAILRQLWLMNRAKDILKEARS